MLECDKNADEQCGSYCKKRCYEPFKRNAHIKRCHKPCISSCDAEWGLKCQARLPVPSISPERKKGAKNVNFGKFWSEELFLTFPIISIKFTWKGTS